MSLYRTRMPHNVKYMKRSVVYNDFIIMLPGCKIIVNGLNIAQNPHYVLYIVLYLVRIKSFKT